jgi:phosphopentomutase
VPLLVYGKKIGQGSLGTRASFADIAATVLAYFGLKGEVAGTALSVV